MWLVNARTVADVPEREGRHVSQWFIFGSLFPILYWLCGLYCFIKEGDWHTSNPFEIDARRAAGEE